MAIPVTDLSAINYSNSRVRKVADLMVQLYYLCKSANVEFTAKGLAATFTNDATPISDGAPNDGRTAIVTQDVVILLAHAATFVNEMESTANLKLNQISKVATNPLPLGV